MKLSTLLKHGFSLAGALVLGAGAAHAAPVLVAGWDFSQYDVGALSVDGATLTNTLESNYSDLDATDLPGLGNGSEYGTLYLDGRFGSFNTPLDGATDPFIPQTPNIDQNVDAAVVSGVPMGSAAAGNLLQNEAGPGVGQLLFNSVRMTAADESAIVPNLLDVVFGVDLGASLVGQGFAVSFGGQTLTGSSNLIVEFSADGSAYTQIGTASLTASAAQYAFVAPATPSALTSSFLRLRFDADNSIRPSVDNVAISADVTVIPEPGPMVLIMSGLTGLAAFGRRRA